MVKSSFHFNTTLDNIGTENYESVEQKLNQLVMTPQRTKTYLNNILKDAKLVRNQLKGYKSHISKQISSGGLAEAEKQMEYQRTDNERVTLNQYIKHHKNKAKTIKGSGIRKKQRGGNVVFFLMM